jgi:hypothetical protein
LPFRTATKFPVTSAAITAASPTTTSQGSQQTRELRSEGSEDGDEREGAEAAQPGCSTFPLQPDQQAESQGGQ